MTMRLPMVRGDCAPGGAMHARPCPFATCRYYMAPERRRKDGTLYADQPSGTQSCALDVADAGISTLDEIGALMGIVRERVRQIEFKAIVKLRAACKSVGLDLEDIIDRPRHALDDGTSRRADNRDPWLQKAAQRRWYERKKIERQKRKKDAA